MTPQENNNRELNHRPLLAKLVAGTLGAAAIIGNIANDTKENIAAVTADAPENSAPLHVQTPPVQEQEQQSKKIAKIDHKKNPEREKTSPCVTFPSGLKLEITSDKDVLREWQDPTKTPLQVLHDTFKGNKTEKDVDPETLKYIKSECSRQVPVVHITREDLDQKISASFAVKELVRIDIKKRHLMEEAGTWKKHEKYMIQDAQGNYCWAYARIDPNLCKQLDELRECAGFPLKIDEGVRPYEYNLDMYKAQGKKVVKGSPHVPGRAVDICRTGDAEKDAKLQHGIRKTLAGKGGGFGDGISVYHFDVKIALSEMGGNWVVDPDTGKVVLRLRHWLYGHAKAKKAGHGKPKKHK